MKKKDIKRKIGKKRLWSNDNSLIAKLTYLDGIRDFDKQLKGKSQVKRGYVIHLIEYPKGILVKLAKNFSSVKFCITFKEIEKLIVSINSAGSFLTIETTNNEIVFKIENDSIEDLVEFMSCTNLKLEFDIKNANNDLISSFNAIETATKYVKNQFTTGLLLSLFFLF